MITKSATEQIYCELMDGAEKGLDWDELLAKYGRSKGPFYNAVSRAVSELKLRHEKLSAETREQEERLKQVNREVTQGEGREKEQDQAIRNGDIRLKNFEKEEIDARERLGKYSKEIQDKQALATSLTALVNWGLSPDKLERLVEVIREIGSRHSLAPNDSVNRFFDDLKLWDKRVGLEAEVQGLSSKKDEIEKKYEETRKRYQDQRAAIEALEELYKHDIGARSILAWHQIALTADVEVGELQNEIQNYGNLRAVITAQDEEKKKNNEEITRAEAHLRELTLRKADVEGAATAMIEEGLKSVRESGEKTKAEIAEATRGIKEEIDGLLGQALKAGEKMGEIDQVLAQKERVKELFHFLSHPHLVPKDDPILVTITSTLLEWVKKNQGSLSHCYQIGNGLETLEKELLK